MDIRYFKEFSTHLNRFMDFKVFGHGGKPCLVFPCQNGRFFDFEHFHMTEIAAPWIEAGKLQLFCVDSIDGESWSDKNGDPRRRSEMQERWYRYVTEELVPRVQGLNGSGEKLMTTGCSMGGAHAVNFFLRRPDLFDTVLAMSGVYEASFFFGDYMDRTLYMNSPVDYMRNLPADHPYISLYNQSRIIICVGQGAWEDELLASTRRLDAVFKEKGINAWFDYWGTDVAHDWPWWQKQFPYFLGHLFGQP